MKRSILFLAVIAILTISLLWWKAHSRREELIQRQEKSQVPEVHGLEPELEEKVNELSQELEHRVEQDGDETIESKDETGKEVQGTLNEVETSQTLMASIDILDETILERVIGVSWKEDCPVPLTELRYLTLPYYGFDGQVHLGEMIVHEKVAEDVAGIFMELFEERYPIEKMKLIDEYDADDNTSMEDNNTSSFCFRMQTGSTKVSKHGYGLAIDINPLQNPYIYKETILPAGAEEYVDRESDDQGMIRKGDVCYDAFTSRGWTWGGDWKRVKDYQHFEKDLEQ